MTMYSSMYLITTHITYPQQKKKTRRIASNDNNGSKPTHERFPTSIANSTPFTVLSPFSDRV